LIIIINAAPCYVIVHELHTHKTMVFGPSCAYVRLSMRWLEMSWSFH